MSTVITTTVLPRDGTNTLNIGGAGDTVAIGGDSLNLNVLQDAGGNNIFTSSSGTVTAPLFGGSLKLLSTQNASDSASISFTTGIDSTYDIYIFKFIDLNPATDNQAFEFQCSTDGGSNYNTTLTSTYCQVYHAENDTGSGLGYDTGKDQGQGTAYQKITGAGIGNLADECGVGELHLFAPSSTTYVKHYYSRTQIYKQDNESFECFSAGYYNTTSAVNAISFRMVSGNFDGTIKMYGISKT